MVTDNWRFVVLVGVGMSLLSCAGSEAVLEWRDESYAGGSFKNLLVIGVAEDATTRRFFEDSFVKELRSLGVRSIASTSLMPDDQRIDKESVKKAISGKEVDAVLITRLVGIEHREVYLPRTPPPNYYSYYSFAYDYAYSPGYYEKYQVLKLESTLYSVEMDKPVWSMQSESLWRDRINSLLDEVVKLNIQKLRRQKFI